MPNSTYFVQPCPTCGRRLHIRVEHLGKQVVCQHCRGAFLSSDASGHRSPAGVADALQRADALLEQIVGQSSP